MATIGLWSRQYGLADGANLLKAGHKVQGFDVGKAQMDALTASGGNAAGSVKAAASGAEIVVTMLPAGQHVRDVYTGADGVLSAAGSNTLLIDCSTIDVETARAVAAAAGGKKGSRCSTRRFRAAPAARRPARSPSWLEAATRRSRARSPSWKKWARRSSSPRSRRRRLPVASTVTADTLVLVDDVESTPGDGLEAFLEALVLHLPPALHLVVACRRAPQLRLARLRAAGEVVRVTAIDLAITAPTRSTTSTSTRRGGTRCGRSCASRAGGRWPCGWPRRRCAGPDRSIATSWSNGCWPRTPCSSTISPRRWWPTSRTRSGSCWCSPPTSRTSPTSCWPTSATTAWSALAEGLAEVGVFLERGSGRRYRASLLGGAFLRPRACPRPTSPSGGEPSSATAPRATSRPRCSLRPTSGTRRWPPP